MEIHLRIILLAVETFPWGHVVETTQIELKKVYNIEMKLIPGGWSQRYDLKKEK